MQVCKTILGWLWFLLGVGVAVAVILAYAGTPLPFPTVDLSPSFGWLWAAGGAVVAALLVAACSCAESARAVVRALVVFPLVCVVGLVYRPVGAVLGAILFIPYAAVYWLVRLCCVVTGKNTV